MALSPSTGFIVPQVWGSGVLARITGNLVFKNFATTFADLQGEPGDTLNLTEFQRLSDLTADAAEGKPSRLSSLRAQRSSSLLSAKEAKPLP